jgi:hypothetical protein
VHRSNNIISHLKDQIIMPQNTDTTTQGNNGNQGQGAKAQGQGQSTSAKKAKAGKKGGQARAAKQGNTNQGGQQTKRERKPRAEKPARQTPAHMAKVDKIANQLPALSGDANTLFVAMKNLSTADLNGILAHLNVEIRRRGVLAAVSQASSGAQGQQGSGGVQVGQRVRIRSGNPRFIGQMGTVAKVQRIRCYVRLDGRDKDDYFFIADVEQVGGQSPVVQGVTASSLAETVQRLTSSPPVIQGGDIHALVDEDESAGAQAATG